MQPLNSTEQTRLIQAIEQAIAHTKQGMTPNEAIEKVATQGKYTPPFIDRMVQGFNKAKTVHMLKEASATDRHKSFDLADSPTIVSRIYNGHEKVASVQFSLPKNLAGVAIHHEALEKTAHLVSAVTEKRSPRLTSASYLRMFEQDKDFYVNMEKKASLDAAEYRHKWKKAMDRICSHCTYMTQKEFEKTASKAINVYPAVGDKMMKIVAYKINRTLPEESLQKTAAGYILPAQEPFLSMQDAYENAKLLAHAEEWHAHVQKEASQAVDTLKTFLTNSAANVFTRDGDNQPTNTITDVDDVLDPKYFNKVKALDNKRALYNIMLNDDKFKSYDSGQVVGAWNALIGSYPKVMLENPEAAANLMLKHLETNGRQDLHELELANKLERGVRGDKIIT